MGPNYTHKPPESARSCAVFSSPHSGSRYPAAFLAASLLDSLAIRSSEDAFVDELFSDAPKFGAHFLTANAPRAYVDLNRRPDELDPAIVRGASRASDNPRIAAGLGIIPRVVGEGQVIQSGKISLKEAQKRIDEYYTPYHNHLSALLDAQRDQYGLTILIDCHSMPQRALENAPRVQGKLADIIIGDRFGISCDRWIVETATRIFEAQGFVVARNAPFSGGYITQHYGRPKRNVHALQIEINRSLYMDEIKIQRRSDFGEFRNKLSEITRGLAHIGLVPINLAAE